MDKLFQEKFTGFSEVPDKKVWERIEASLDKKKKNRTVIPIWWKLGGVAAVLAILLYAINPFGKAFKVDQKVTDIEKVDTNSQEKTTDKEDFFEILQEGNTKIANSSKVNIKNDPNTIQDVKESAPSYTSIEKSVAPRVKPTQKDKDNILNKNHAAIEEIQLTDIKNQSKDLAEDSASTHKNHALITNDINEALAVSDTEAENKKTKATNTDFDGNKVNIEKSVLDNSNNLKKEGIVNVEEDDKNEVEDLKGKSIFDEIKKQKEENTKIVENTAGKWSVGANVAPVYFNGFGKGSPVHSIFVSNSKSGNVNLSYGLSVSYEINKKLSIRSGINKVDYGYDTNEVEFTSSFGISGDEQIANIDYTAPSVNLIVESKVGNNVGKEVFAEFSDLNVTRDGIMAQRFGYLEIPVELNYALIDKRFGVDIIGGVSSLFLMNNSVAVTSKELTTEIGEANNLNTINFSTNIGFGVSYKFSPKVQLNIEPVFKYQLNTFSNTAGSFQPFSAGIYSGLNFKF